MVAQVGWAKDHGETQVLSELLLRESCSIQVVETDSVPCPQYSLQKGLANNFLLSG